MGLEEAEKIHAEADIDGDGQVTLEELKSQPEVTERMALPKPVKPIRAGIKNTPPAQQPQPINQQQQQQQAGLLSNSSNNSRHGSLNNSSSNNSKHGSLSNSSSNNSKAGDNLSSLCNPLFVQVYIAVVVELVLTQIGVSAQFVEHRIADYSMNFPSSNICESSSHIDGFVITPGM